jgi:hypothetical protein
MKRGSATRAHKRLSEFERFNALAVHDCDRLTMPPPPLPPTTALPAP